MQPLKSKTVAVLLALFLGTFGIHRFYLGRWVSGLVYLLFCWTWIPSVVSFFEAIVMIFLSKDEWMKRWGSKPDPAASVVTT